MAIRLFHAVDSVSELLGRLFQDEQAANAAAERLAVFGSDGVIITNALLTDRTTLDLIPDELDQDYAGHPLYTADSFISILESDKIGYDRESLKTITAEDQLATEDVRTKILRTAWLLTRRRDPDIALAMTEMFDRVTDSTMHFLNLPWPDSILYRKIYLYIVMLYGDAMSPRRILHILGSRFLPLALSLDMDIPFVMREQMDIYTSVDERKSLSFDMAAALATNKSPFGVDMKRNDVSVQYWIDKVALLHADTDSGKAKELFLQDADYVANNPEDQLQLQRLISIYISLGNGDFVLGNGSRELFFDLREDGEISSSVQAAVETERETPEAKTKDLSGFEEELIARKGHVALWLANDDAGDICSIWLDTIPMSERRHALISVLDRYISLATLSDDEIGAIVAFGESLYKSEHLPSSDLIGFNEQQESFVWI